MSLWKFFALGSSLHDSSIALPFFFFPVSIFLAYFLSFYFDSSHDLFCNKTLSLLGVAMCQVSKLHYPASLADRGANEMRVEVTGKALASGKLFIVSCYLVGVSGSCSLSVLFCPFLFLPT